MKKLYNVFADFAVAVVVIGIIVGGIHLLMPRKIEIVSTNDSAPHVSLTAERLSEIVEPCEKLVSASAAYTNTATISKHSELFGHKVPFTTDEIEFTYSGTVLVGVDLSEINFDVNDAGKNIYVTLSAPEIISHDIDTGSFTFTTNHDGLFTDITSEDFVAKANQLKAAQAEKVQQDGSVFRQAKKSAETAIGRLIQAAPEASGYRLHFFFK